MTKSNQLTPFTLNTDIIEDGCISGLHLISDLKMDLSLLIVSTIRRYERGHGRSRFVYKVRLGRFWEVDG